MADIWTAFCNSIWLILEAISKFDIRMVDETKLAQMGEVTAYLGRAVYHFIRILVIIAQR